MFVGVAGTFHIVIQFQGTLETQKPSKTIDHYKYREAKVVSPASVRVAIHLVIFCVFLINM